MAKQKSAMLLGSAHTARIMARRTAKGFFGNSFIGTIAASAASMAVSAAIKHGDKLVTEKSAVNTWLEKS